MQVLRVGSAFLRRRAARCPPSSAWETTSLKDFLPASASEVASNGKEGATNGEKTFAAIPSENMSIQAFVRDMKRSVALRGGLGMAAPQLGVSLSLFVMPNVWKVDAFKAQDYATTGDIVRRYLRGGGNLKLSQESDSREVIEEQARSQQHRHAGMQRRRYRERRRGKDGRNGGSDHPFANLVVPGPRQTPMVDEDQQMSSNVDAWLDELYSVVINPRITWESQRKAQNYEGCYSVPGYIVSQSMECLATLGTYKRMHSKQIQAAAPLS